MARYFDLVEVGCSIQPASSTNNKYKEMKILTLSIKQKYFDEILAGKKTHEYREIRPTNAKRYIRYKLNGKLYEDADDVPSDEEEPGEVTLALVKYDAIKLLTGAYSGKRPYIIIEVKAAEVAILTDESGEDIVYEYKGENYLAAQMDYTLGKILEKHID